MITFIFSLTSLHLLFICSITRPPSQILFFIFLKIFNKNGKYRRYIAPKPIYRRYFRFFPDFSVNRLSMLYIVSIDTDTRYIDDISSIYRDIFNNTRWYTFDWRSSYDTICTTQLFTRYCPVQDYNGANTTSPTRPDFASLLGQALKKRPRYIDLHFSLSERYGTPRVVWPTESYKVNSLKFGPSSILSIHKFSR